MRRTAPGNYRVAPPTRKPTADSCLFLAGCLAGETLRTFACRVALNARNHSPTHLVLLGNGDQLMAEIGIAHRSLADICPTASRPAILPLGDAVDDEAATGVQCYLAGLDQGSQGMNSGGKFHAIESGVRLTARQRFLVRSHAQDRTPASGPRVAVAGTTGKDLDLFHGIRQNSYHSHEWLRKLRLDFAANLPLPVSMDIDAEERLDLPRRLFAMVGRRLELATGCAGRGEAAGLGREAITDLAANIYDCGQDLLVLADAIAVIAQEAAE